MVSEVPKMIVLRNFATKSRLKASLAVWRNQLPYISQGGLQPGSLLDKPPLHSRLSADFQRRALFFK